MPGDIVTLVRPNGQFLARGYFNPRSQIVVRILTWQDEAIDEGWWRRALERAIHARTAGGFDARTTTTGARRLINAENDFLPGLIVDQYGRWLVLQALTLGIDLRKTHLAELLWDIVQPDGIYERSDVDVRGKEGLKPVNAVLKGDAPPGLIDIEENGLRFQINLERGHKTGFYLDQRENRRLVQATIEELRRTQPGVTPNCLNLFSYTGGFGLYAASAGAGDVANVDSSHEALELAEANFALNGLPTDGVEFIQANVFDYLRDMREANALYDLVVLDPPKFAQNAQQVERAARGYKDLNLNAFACVKPGGYLFTFSCSGGVSADLFQKIVFGALADSGRQAQILRHLGPGDDHPVALTFPEGAYLKGLLLRVY
jgi:23S rRNA (cytosine1962-C5)-methyltransferase